MRTLGKYEVLDELGAGAMGKVFHGRDRVLQREVAIKTISTEDADVELKQRFYREARACGRLSHPNIVTVYDLGEQQGTSYIAMEYLKGEDLRKFIDRKAFMPLEGKLQVISEVVDGLSHAHDNKITHRDIKPSNIFLLESGRPKILDFGIARVYASQLTRVGNALGTPEYMAPEQIRGKETDARSDIFSAAVVFFELLTFEHPFGTSDIPRKIIQDPPKSLRAANPLMPVKLEQILSKAMAKDPAERFQTAAEFGKAMRKLSYEVMGQCGLMMEEALQTRQHILDSLAIISNTGDIPWIQKRLQEERVDVGIVGKISPEMAMQTNAGLHYFTLNSLAKDLSRTADVLSEIATIHQGIRSAIEEARKLLAEGNGVDALRVLDAHKDRKAEYREIESLRAEIEKRIASSQAAAAAPPGPQATIATPSKPPADGVSPEVLAVRKRIAALLEEDIDKCLAEIEILSPALAQDSVIDSYWVRALSMRSTQQAGSAAAAKAHAYAQAQAQSQPQAPVSEEAQTLLSVPAYDPPPRRADTPTVFVGSVESPAAKKLDPKVIGGIAAAVIIIVVIAVFAFKGGSEAPATAIESPGAAINPAATSPDPAPAAPLATQQPTSTAKKAEQPAAKSRQAKAAVQTDWSKELAAATQAFASENYDEALSICDKILASQPANQAAADLRQRALGAKALVERLNSKRN